MTAAEEIIAAQYVARGETQVEAQNEVASLNACFGTYEVPPENRNHPKDADLTHLALNSERTRENSTTACINLKGQPFSTEPLIMAQHN